MFPTVYVVDGEPEARRSLAELAAATGIRCQTFASAEEFLDTYCRTNLVGCLLIDLRLNEMSGLGLLQRLAELGSKLPAIVVSGHADVSTVVRAMQCGTHTVIEKPDQSDALLDAIREALGLAGRIRRQRRSAGVVRRRHRNGHSRRADRWFRRIVQAARDAVVTMDHRGKISFWNKAAAEMFGYAAREVLGKNLHDLLAAPRYLESFAKAFPIFQRAGRGGAVGKTVPLDAVRKNGEEFPIELSLSVVRRDGAWHAVATVRDITERKNAEQALRASEEKYRSLAETTYDVPYSLDAHGIMQYVGPQAERYGLRPADMLSHHFREFLVPEDQERMVAEFHRVISTSVERVSDFRIADPQGNVYWLEDRGKLQQDESGRIIGVAGVLRDITGRKAAEESLRKKEDELRQSQKLDAMGQLAGGIAHEFNNLLQAIGGYVHLVMEQLPSEDGRYQDLQQVRKATERAAALTRQLLGFARRQILQRSNVDPNQVLSDLYKMIRPLIGEHIDVDLRLAETMPSVYADAGELLQMLLDLCLNAKDAMPIGGRLVLQTESVSVDEPIAASHSRIAPGHYAVLSVSDTGHGMTPEVKKRIFEPFFTTKEIGKGTGLGLATVYGIVQQHEGAVHVLSELDQGSEFQIYLPAVFAAADAEESRDTQTAPGGRETILVAEDEPMVRQLAARILRGAGYNVWEASDGEEALRLFDEHAGQISLLFLDAGMSKLGGHAVYRCIKEKNPHVKALLCTGYDPELMHAQGATGDDLCVLAKPFSRDVLLRTVRQVLDQ